MKRRPETRLIVANEHGKICEFFNVEIIEFARDNGRTLELFIRPQDQSFQEEEEVEEEKQVLNLPVVTITKNGELGTIEKTTNESKKNDYEIEEFSKLLTSFNKLINEIQPNINIQTK